jgi:hypothetical protein
LGIPGHARPGHSRDGERLRRQQQAPPGGEVLADRGRAARDVAGVLGGIGLGQPAFSTASDAAFGTGTNQRRRNRPTSP